MRGRISRVVAPPRHGRGESNATQGEVAVAWQGVMHGSNERAVAEMKKSPKRLDRPSFWKWAIPLVLGSWFLSILPLSSAARSVGGPNAAVIVRLTVATQALARLVLIVLLAMALARRFRDIGWPAWIGPTTLL